MTDAREVIAKYAAKELFEEGHDCPRRCDGVCKGDCSMWKIDILGHTDAILAALKAAGLVVVPREPTDAMYRAFYETDSLAGTGTRNRFNKGWRAMVEAAHGE